MIKKIAWVTDSAPLLDKEFIAKYNIHVLPLNIVFEEGPLKETVDMTHGEFYEKLRMAKKHPKTSQPVFGDMVDLYKNLKEQGYDCAIAVHLSKFLSGTYESAFIAAEQADFKVYPIDSKIGSFPMAKMIEVGKAMEAEGSDVEEIVNRLDDMTNNSELSFIPSSLAQLHKSGRVSGTAAFLSNLLKINLVITFDNGKIVMKEKVRGNKRARQYVKNLLQADLAKASIPEVAIINCNNEPDAQAWKSELETEFPDIRFIISPLSAAVGVHAGEGTTGLSWVRY